MSQRANFQKNYLMRYAILAGVCLLLAAWFAYDGFIGYPSKLPMARAYDELRELDAEERIAKWQEVTTERGWSQETPEKEAAEIEDDITGQYFWAGLNLLAGIPALILFLRSRGSWVEPIEGGLTTSWGQTVKFADVTALNKKRWLDKGIARASYQSHGLKKTFVFDDFKFEREPLGAMLRDLEEFLPREKITGGPSEAETAAKKTKEQEDAEQEEAAMEADSTQHSDTSDKTIESSPKS